MFSDIRQLSELKNGFTMLGVCPWANADNGYTGSITVDVIPVPAPFCMLRCNTLLFVRKYIYTASCLMLM